MPYHSTGPFIRFKEKTLQGDVESQSARIGKNTPNASTILDITSTPNGLLAPRMTIGECTGIASPQATEYCIPILWGST